MTARVVVESLGKQFRRYHPDRAWTLQEVFLRGARRLAAFDRFWVFRNVSFDVAPGEALGIIGENGAGKSTLLRLIGRVGKPDEGSVQVDGRIGALIDIGAGFHADLTGRENVFVAGIIGGLTRREVAQRFDAIVDFSELHDSIDSPLRTYSTGMQMRLAFSVAVHVDPVVFLIDETLAVGDISFQNKCLERIIRFKCEGCAIVLVSHDAALVRALCDRALWLRHGGAAQLGSVDALVDEYSADAMKKNPSELKGMSARVVHP